MEKKREVKRYLVSLYCDRCGAKMFGDFFDPDSRKPYVYKCEKCGYSERSKTNYPFYEEIIMEL